MKGQPTNKAKQVITSFLLLNKEWAVTIFVPRLLRSLLPCNLPGSRQPWSKYDLFISPGLQMTRPVQRHAGTRLWRSQRRQVSSWSSVWSQWWWSPIKKHNRNTAIVEMLPFVSQMKEFEPPRTHKRKPFHSWIIRAQALYLYFIPLTGCSHLEECGWDTERQNRGNTVWKDECFQRETCINAWHLAPWPAVHLANTNRDDD